MCETGELKNCEGLDSASNCIKGQEMMHYNYILMYHSVPCNIVLCIHRVNLNFRINLREVFNRKNRYSKIMLIVRVDLPSGAPTPHGQVFCDFFLRGTFDFLTTNIDPPLALFYTQMDSFRCLNFVQN